MGGPGNSPYPIPRIIFTFDESKYSPILTPSIPSPSVHSPGSQREVHLQGCHNEGYLSNLRSFHMRSLEILLAEKSDSHIRTGSLSSKRKGRHFRKSSI